MNLEYISTITCVQSLISASSIASACFLSAFFKAALFIIVSQNVDAVSAIGIG